MRSIRLATRGSELALVQARAIVAALAALDEPVRAEILVVETKGDRRQDVPIHSVGGQGIFVKEVEAAVLDGRAEFAVHSAKDLPAGDGESALEILAVPPRGDPRDALVGCSLARLAPGARVATGSVRRRAQLAWLRPDLTFTELRGNMATRLSRVPEGGAVVTAHVALERLGRKSEADEVLSTVLMLPQVGQGALAVCGRPDRGELAELVAQIDDAPSHIALVAERAYLRAVGGGCDLPVGAYAEVERDGTVRIEAMLASLDGHTVIRRSLGPSYSRDGQPSSGAGGEGGSYVRELGEAVARLVLEESGGGELLDRIGRQP
ncbi:MAG: hydroxymethylbilane synthase [Acidimicrobiales bacterium]